jgi:hypothetical protein
MDPITPDERPDDIQSRAMIFATTAAAFTVESAQEYENGIEALQRIKRLRQSWDGLQRPAIRAAKKAHDEAIKAFRTIDDKLALAYDTIKDRCEAWVEQRRHARREQLQPLVLPPTSADVEAALGHDFDAAVAAGDTAKAARILEQSALPPMMQSLPPPPVPPLSEAVPKVAGVAVTTPYTFEIVDETLLPREYLCPDRKRIAAVVKAMQEHTKIPGVVVRPDTGLRIRA